MEFAVTIIVLIVIYSVLLGALAQLFRKMGLATAQAIFAAFLTFGIITAILVAWRWPYDSSVLINFPAAWLGDWLYGQTIAWIGDPYSDHAGETIPWLLRVPQVYVVASCILYGMLGSVLELLYRHSRGV